MNNTELTPITPSKNNTLEPQSITASTVPPAPSDGPQMDLVVDLGDTDTAGDYPADIINVCQIAIDALKPHPMNAAVYGDEPVDENLVASIKNLKVLIPLHATAGHVVVDGHRRLKAARAAERSTVPVIILDSRLDDLVIEEMLLESNRSRKKTNEQRIREFIAFQRIETQRAKTRAGRRTDLLPKSAGGSSAEPTGSARDLAAKKVGMSGSRAAHGEAVVLVIDRLHNGGDLAAAHDLQEILNTKTIETAHGAAIKHGWIVAAPKRQSRKATTEITEDGAVGEHGGKVVGAASRAVPVDAPAESNPPSQIAHEPAAGDAAHADIGPGEEVSVHIDAPTCVEQEFAQPQMSLMDGQNQQLTNVLPVGASVPQSTVSENQPPGPGTVFRLADGREIFIATSSESDLITEKKLRTILQVSAACSDKDTIGVEGLTRRQRFVILMTETMNRLGKDFPDVPAQRLWREFCTANLIFQKQMKWN